MRRGVDSISDLGWLLKPIVEQGKFEGVVLSVQTRF